MGKGIGPLISVVLLIGFVVTMVAMVNVWTGNTLETLEEESEKDIEFFDEYEDVNFDLESSSLSSSSSSLYLDIVNKGRDFTLIVKVVDTNGVETPCVSSVIVKGYERKEDTITCSSVGSADYFLGIPQIILESGDARIVREKIIKFTPEVII